MKQLFLTSSVHAVAHDIAKKLPKPANKHKLVFITTPAEPEIEAAKTKKDIQWLTNDRKSLVKAGFKVTDYTFTDKKKSEVKKELSKYDIIYMSGGWWSYTLGIIQKKKLKTIFQDLVLKKGKIYIGTSAGSMLAAQDMYPAVKNKDKKISKKLVNYKGLELVDFLVFPHWGGDKFESDYLNDRLPHAYKTAKHPIIFLSDNQYVHVKDDWYRIESVKHS